MAASLNSIRNQPVILLAEDNEDDIFVIRRAFKQAFLEYRLEVVHDGGECIGYLAGTGKFADRAQHPLPDLLLLDLKMPRIDGFEVLEWLQNQPTLKSLRVIVLTSSQSVRDVNRAYSLGANSFLVKPSDFENYIAMAKFFSTFWFGLSKAPEITRPPSPPDTPPPSMPSQ